MFSQSRIDAMSEDLFAEIQEEEKMDFSEIIGEETPEGSQPEDTTEEETPAQEGEPEDVAQTSEETPVEENIPFHEHPRWKQREEDWKTRFESQEQENNRRFEELQGKVQSVEQSNSVPEIDPTLIPLIGDNPEAHRAWKEMQQKERQQIRQDVAKEMSQKRQDEKDQVDRWNNWVDTEVSRLKTEGRKFDKNALLKVALDYRPTDDKGNISFDKALTILEATKPRDSAKAKAKKEVASQVTSKATGGSAEPSKVITQKDVRNRPWY
jgi:hypothetical protein